MILREGVVPVVSPFCSCSVTVAAPPPPVSVLRELLKGLNLPNNHGASNHTRSKERTVREHFIPVCETALGWGLVRWGGFDGAFEENESTNRSKNIDCTTPRLHTMLGPGVGTPTPASLGLALDEDGPAALLGCQPGVDPLGRQPPARGDPNPNCGGTGYVLGGQGLRKQTKGMLGPDSVRGGRELERSGDILCGCPKKIVNGEGAGETSTRPAL